MALPELATTANGSASASDALHSFTGAACTPWHGHFTGADFAVQGNMLTSDAVWQAMGPAFESAQGDLAERLMLVLEAAEHAGGDVRGKQSAALLVVGGERLDNDWEGRNFDLHVEDDPYPLQELRRLLTLRRAYALFKQARGSFGAGDLDGALALVMQARKLHPGDFQFCFWTGVALANSGRDEQARQWLSEAFRDSEVWRELGRRLREAGLFTGDPGLLEP